MKFSKIIFTLLLFLINGCAIKNKNFDKKQSFGSTFSGSLWAAAPYSY